MGFFLGKKEIILVTLVAGFILSCKFFNSIRYAADKKTRADYVHSIQNKEKQLEENYRKT